VTSTEFQALKTTALSEFGQNYLADKSGADATNARLASQDRELAKEGVNIHRQGYQQELKSFFQPPDSSASFSFVVVRSANVSQGQKTIKLSEVNAVSTIYFSGHIILLSVLESSDGPIGISNAKDVTAKWLSEFRRINQLPKQ